MDDARKLLDSLMGQTRNQDMSEARKSKGQNFMKDDVCKHYLLGFCPVSELGESKMAGKRNIGECRKVHSDAMKKEYESHPEKEKYKSEYENLLLPVLEAQAREADAWTARERANVQKVSGPPEKVTTNSMPPTVKEQYDALREDMNKMMAAAELEAEKGNVDGSKFKVMLADEIKEKVNDLEAKYIVTYTVTHRGEDVCDICGTRYEALTATNHARHAAHFQGKVHLTYAKIRDWIKDLRRKQRDADERRSAKEPGRGGSREEDAPRRRSRSRSRPQERQRAGSRDRERRRSRSRRRPGRSREGREERGGGGGGRERRRSRSARAGERRGRDGGV